MAVTLQLVCGAYAFKKLAPTADSYSRELHALGGRPVGVRVQCERNTNGAEAYVVRAIMLFDGDPARNPRAYGSHVVSDRVPCARDHSL